MDYQCGDCNAPLDEKTLDSGRCPACGARISPFGDVIRAGNAPADQDSSPVWPADGPRELLLPLDSPTLADSRRLPITRHERIAIAHAKPFGSTMADDQTAPDRATSLGLIAGIGIAAIMVVICTLSFVSTAMGGFGGPSVATHQTVLHKPTPNTTNDPNNLGFTTQVADPTALPYNYATPTLEPTTTPFGGPPTGTPGSGEQFIASTVQCGPSGSASFTLSTSSETPITFIASTNNAQEKVNPNSGTVSNSQPIALAVTSIKPSFKQTMVTITDPSGTVPPIQVQVACP